MKPLDLLTFQFGNRGAIERAASSCWTLVVGAILVATAVLARNYDGVSLLDSPEFIWRPFGASLISSLMIFAVAYFPLELGGIKGRPRTGFGWQYLSFLGVFWLTAPIAWFYAIPVEHWWTPLAAAKWNVWMLGFVAFWRLVLISRVLAVLTGRGFFVCLLIVSCPAMLEVFGAIWLLNMNLVEGMGGVRLVASPEKLFIRDVSNQIIGFSCIGTFIAGATIFGLGVAGLLTLPPKKTRRSRLPKPRFDAMPLASLLIALTSLAGWIALGLKFQPDLQRLEKMETMIRSQRFELAVAYLDSHGPGAFPEYRAIPPDPWESIIVERRLSGMLRALDADTVDWIVDLYRDHTLILLSRVETTHGNFGTELFDAVTAHPSGKEFVRENQEIWITVAQGGFKPISYDYEELTKRLNSIGIDVPPPRP
ncbi:MAG: hypothetical protein ACI8UO_001998 [Verrucomicrobiales bacterium]